VLKGQSASVRVAGFAQRGSTVGTSKNGRREPDIQVRVRLDVEAALVQLSDAAPRTDEEPNER